MPRRLSAPFRNESRRIRRGRGQPLVFALLRLHARLGSASEGPLERVAIDFPALLDARILGRLIPIAARKVSTSRPARPGKTSHIPPRGSAH